MLDFANQVQETIDLIWDEHDADKSGFLDKKETQEFVKHTLQYLDAEKAEKYTGDNFDEAFEKWDKDGNKVV